MSLSLITSLPLSPQSAVRLIPRTRFQLTGKPDLHSRPVIHSTTHPLLNCSVNRKGTRGSHGCSTTQQKRLPCRRQEEDLWLGLSDGQRGPRLSFPCRFRSAQNRSHIAPLVPPLARPGKDLGDTPPLPQGTPPSRSYGDTNVKSTPQPSRRPRHNSTSQYGCRNNNNDNDNKGQGGLEGEQCEQSQDEDSDAPSLKDRFVTTIPCRTP